MNNQTHEPNYDNLKPVPGELIYVDYDSDVEMYGAFGSQSGFCYLTDCDESAAIASAQQRYPDQFSKDII